MNLENHINKCTIYKLSSENNLDKDLKEYSFKLAQKYELIQKIFAGLSEEFQVWQDFINYNVRFSKEKPFFLQEKIDESAPLYGEDLLITMTNYRDTLLTLEDFQKVMNKGATLPALIAYKFIYNHKASSHFNWDNIEEQKKVMNSLREMIVLAARKNDFRALEYTIQTWFNSNSKKNNTKYKLAKLNLDDL